MTILPILVKLVIFLVKNVMVEIQMIVQTVNQEEFYIKTTARPLQLIVKQQILILTKQYQLVNFVIQMENVMIVLVQVLAKLVICLLLLIIIYVYVLQTKFPLKHYLVNTNVTFLYRLARLKILTHIQIIICVYFVITLAKLVRPMPLFVYLAKQLNF